MRKSHYNAKTKQIQLFSNVRPHVCRKYSFRVNDLLRTTHPKTFLYHVDMTSVVARDSLNYGFSYEITADEMEILFESITQ